MCLFFYLGTLYYFHAILFNTLLKIGSDVKQTIIKVKVRNMTRRRPVSGVINETIFLIKDIKTTCKRQTDRVLEPMLEKEKLFKLEFVLCLSGMISRTAKPQAIPKKQAINLPKKSDSELQCDLPQKKLMFILGAKYLKTNIKITRKQIEIKIRRKIKKYIILFKYLKIKSPPAYWILNKKLDT